MNRLERHQEKQRLLAEIQQQRWQLATQCEQWLTTTAAFDRGWVKLLGLHKYMVLGSSLVAIYSIRHPSKIIRWSRRALELWGTSKLFRRAFLSRSSIGG